MSARCIRTPSGLTVAGLLAAFLVTAALNCRARDLWEPEELRYAEVTREMVNSGEYFLLHLNGLVYPEKPPLYFWSMALSAKVFGGMNDWAMRFPTAAAGFGCCVLTLLLARRLHGEAAGVLSALVLFVTPYFAKTASEARMDVLLTFFIMLSLYCFYLAHEERRHEGRRLVGMWILFALGTLTKGPIGVVLPLLTIVVYLLWRRDWRYLWTRKWWFVLGLAIFALLVAGWLVPACVKGGSDFTRNILYKQNVERYTDAWDHEGKALLRFAWIFPLVFLPWTLFLPGFIRHAVRGIRAGKSTSLALPAIWWSVIFIFFTFSSGKRTVYMVPLEPAAAIMVGWVLAEFWRDPRAGIWRRLVGVPLCICLLLLLAGGIAAAPAVGRKYPQAVPGLWPVCVVMCPIAVAGLVFWFRRRLRASLVALACGIVLPGWMGLATVMPYVNTHKSARLMLAEVESFLCHKDELALFGTIRAGYSFYWGRDIPIIEKGDAAALVKLLSRPKPASVLLKRKFLKGKDAVDELRGMLGSHATILWKGRLGGRKLALVSNHKAPSAAASSEPAKP